MKKQDTARVAKALGKAMAEHLPPANHGVRLLGPAPAPISKIKGKTRWQLLLKGPTHAALDRPLAAAEALLPELPSTVRVVSVVDRTKEPGAAGEPLYQDVVTAVHECMQDGTAPWPTAPAARAIVRNQVSFRPPIVIDARLKPGFPAELSCDPDTAALVTRRWKEYFPGGGVEMGDAESAHLDRA